MHGVRIGRNTDRKVKLVSVREKVCVSVRERERQTDTDTYIRTCKPNLTYISPPYVRVGDGHVDENEYVALYTALGVAEPQCRQAFRMAQQVGLLSLIISNSL